MVIQITGVSLIAMNDEQLRVLRDGGEVSISINGHILARGRTTRVGFIEDGFTLALQRDPPPPTSIPGSGRLLKEGI